MNETCTELQRAVRVLKPKQFEQVAFTADSSQACAATTLPPTHYPPRKRLWRNTGLPSEPPQLAQRPVLPRRRALLIGINYMGETTTAVSGALVGCIGDSLRLAEILKTCGWKEDEMRIMTEEAIVPQLVPTRKNILDSIKWLVEDARAGDVFFFSFSGHGAQMADPHGMEQDGMNETLLPLDWERSGEITDDLLNHYMVRPLPDGSKLFALVDACHSGTALDLPFVWNRRNWKEEVNPVHTRGDVQLLSGCKDDEFSAEVDEGGSMTQAFISVLQQYKNGGLTYAALFDEVHKELRKNGFYQRPMLTSSQQFRRDRPFIITDIIPNANMHIGIFVRKRFTPPDRRIVLARWFIIWLLLAVFVSVLLAVLFDISHLSIVLLLLVGVCIGVLFQLFCGQLNLYAILRCYVLRVRDKSTKKLERVEFLKGKMEPLAPLLAYPPESSQGRIRRRRIAKRKDRDIDVKLAR